MCDLFHHYYYISHMKFILVFCLILAFGSALIVSTNTTNKTSVIWPGPKKITLT